jgi:hypothetical protein
VLTCVAGKLKVTVLVLKVAGDDGYGDHSEEPEGSGHSGVMDIIIYDSGLWFF